MYDAIIVGARCAGAATGLLLARQGYRVLLVDRTGFPSDTMSTHGLHIPAVAALQRWGLLDAVIAAGTPPISRFTFDTGYFALHGTPPPVDGVTVEYAPRRKVLDNILVEAAVAAGVELREHTTVRDLTWEGDRITGIRSHSKGGTPTEDQAHIVIGADGRSSLVARTVQAPAYNERPAQTCFYYTYWSGMPLDGTTVYMRPARGLTAFNTNDGLVGIAVQWPHAEFQAVRADIEGHYMAALDLVPDLAARVRGAEQAERFVGTGDLATYFRKPYGPGWALVGDAGHYLDPMTAHGISDAFRDAELLTSALHAGLSGVQPLDEALAGYEGARNEAAMPIHELTAQLAALEPPPPEMQQLLVALIGNPGQTDRFFGALTGTVPIPEFMSPANLGSIMAAAGPPAA